jgi:cell division protein FtsZ
VEQAVAEAITQQPAASGYDMDDGVTVEPYIPAAAHAPLEENMPMSEAPVPSVYVPSDAERPAMQRRMPRTEELPAVARRSLPDQEKQDTEPRNARALFKRLASNVGLGMKQNPPLSRPAGRSEEVDDAAARSAIEAGATRVSHAPSPAEGAHGQLDGHGRPLAQPAVREHIEIPAFLRKHG